MDKDETWVVQKESCFKDKAIFRAYASVTKALQPLAAEQIQLRGLENLLEEGEEKTGPFLWLFKHESDLDVVNLMPTWYALQKPPGMKVVMGIPSYIKVPLVSKAIVSAMKPAFIPLNVIPWSKGISEDEKQKLRHENNETLEKSVLHYKRGTHIAIFPEGKTQSDGNLSLPKRGCHALAQWRNSFDELEGVDCVPVGNTYDFLSGEKGLYRKPLVFLNIGEPFHYELIERADDETDEEFEKRDQIAFLEQVRNYFINLNTITVSQLAGEYLHRTAIWDSFVTDSKIYAIVKERVLALQELPGLHFDEALLEEDTLRKRVSNFYTALVEEGYVREFDNIGYINLDRLYLEPSSLKNYKQENILKYMTNRIKCVAEERKDIGEVLDKLGHFNIPF